MSEGKRFIGRKQELDFLESKYAEDRAQLIVLYGRRRVGKTETLREFCREKPHVFFSCVQTADRNQLLRFSGQILRENIPAARYIKEFPDWEAAFRSVADLPYGEQKKLLVIDEFPYMCRGNASIPSILQNVWDAELKDRNVMIILCGSALSFIEKELLSEKNPLYGRATGIYKMREMGFYDAVQFFPDYSPVDKVIAYSVLGGIPHYLNQFDPGKPLDDNIRQNILTKGSVLYSEVEFLLHQELRETSVYTAIIEAIALGSTRLNEISQKSLLDNPSKTSVYLKNLAELGIVEREFSVDVPVKAKAVAGRGFYRLTDNFFRFWYTFVYANYSQLEDGDVDGIYEYVIKPDLHEFAAYTFEDVCREFLKECQKRRAFPFRYSKIGRWMGKTTVRDPQHNGGIRTAETEIDIMCINEKTKEYLIGECKFKGAPFRYSEYLDVLAKHEALKKDGIFYYALFSESGFDQKIMENAEKSENIMLYPLEEIVEDPL